VVTLDATKTDEQIQIGFLAAKETFERLALVLNDDGSIISTDTYMWSQCPAIWTFAAYYNRFEKRAEFLDVAGTFKKRLGPLLFQLPPNLKKDVPRLTAFLALLPANHRAAFEFRNDSWFDDAVYAALREAGASLCFSEREDNAPPPLVQTAPWGYVRLRLEHYSDDDLAGWAARLAATGWSEVFAYFMHEPTAPGYASTLTRLAGAQARR
jgi:uncharacterized protein YecE (DUF72 family)